MTINAIAPKTPTVKMKRYDVIQTLMRARSPRKYLNEATHLTFKPEKEVEYFSPFATTGKVFNKKA